MLDALNEEDVMARLEWLNEQQQQFLNEIVKVEETALERTAQKGKVLIKIFKIIINIKILNQH